MNKTSAKKKNEWFWNTLLYCLWMLFVLGTAVYADFYDKELHRMTGRFWMVLIGVPVLAPLLLKWIRERAFKKHRLGDRLPDWAFRSICFFGSMAFLVFLFLGVNPGGFDGDPVFQLKQIAEGRYTDALPILHTLLVLWLPLTLTGGWPSSVILFQILLFSLAITYACDTVRKYGDTFWAFLSLILILLNPITHSYLMYAYKDETFGTFAMVLVSMNAHILFSRGEWMKKPLHLIGYAVIFAAASLVRYNGFLLTVPCALGAALCVNRKRMLAALGAALVLIIGVRGPLSSAIGVEKETDRSGQTSGLPMSVIGAAVKYSPEKLDEELLSFAYSVAPAEVWEEEYEYGVYNWVAWNERFNLEPVSQAGLFGRFAYMFRAILEAPRESLKGLIETTDIVYGIVPDQLADGAVYLAGEEYGMEDLSVPWIRDLMYAYRRWMYVLAPHAFLHSGVSLFLLLTVGLARLSLKKRESWKRIIVALSVFIYNLVTMFVLFSWWDGARFFHITIWLLPVLLVILVHQEDAPPEYIALPVSGASPAEPRKQGNE